MRIYAKIHKLIDIKKEMGKKEVCSVKCVMCISR